MNKKYTGFIRGFVFVIVGLSFFITLFSLIIPSRIVISRSVVINAPVNIIKQNVEHLSQWKNWQPFAQAYPNVQYSASSLGDSSIAKWEIKNKVQTIQIDSIGPNALKFSTVATGHDDVANMISYLPVNNSGGSTVQWTAVIKLPWYPWRKFRGLFLEQISGPAYTAALDNLKTFIEK